MPAAKVFHGVVFLCVRSAEDLATKKVNPFDVSGLQPAVYFFDIFGSHAPGRQNRIPDALLLHDHAEIGQTIDIPE